MEFCFFYFLCLFIICFLSKNLISARLVTQCWLICVAICVCVCVCVCFVFLNIYIIRLGWIGPWIRPKSGWTGPVGPVKTRRGGFGAKNKTRLLNGPGPGNGGGPVGRVRASKNPARTRLIAFPRLYPYCFWESRS